MLFFYVLITLCFGIFDADNYVFPPLQSSGKEQLAILIPGGGVPIGFYNLTIQAIQMQTQAKLWFAVPNFHNTVDLCDPLDKGPWGLDAKVKDAISDAEKASGRSFENKDIWIFGHSLGTACAQVYFNKGYAGFALFGGCIPNQVGFDKVQERVMCFVGELDLGMSPTIMSYMMDNFESLSKSMGMNEALAFRPMGMAPHMCHLDFSPGYEAIGSHFTSELTTAESLHIIGEISAAFVGYDENNVLNKAAQLSTYQTYYDNAVALLNPYRTLAKIQNTTWCGSYAQKEVVHMDDSEWQKNELIQTFVTEDNPFSIEHCHTNCTKGSNGGLVFNVSSMAEYSLFRSQEVSYGVGTMSLSAADLACKMVSRDKVGVVLGESWDNDRTCKDINQLAIDTAMDLLQNSGYQSTAYERFKRIGKPFLLLEDKKITIGPQWCITKAGFNVKSDHVESQGIQLLSPVTSSIYPGNFYCKLLSPARVVEWAMARGLPHNVSATALSKNRKEFSSRLLD